MCVTPLPTCPFCLSAAIKCKCKFSVPSADLYEHLEAAHQDNSYTSVWVEESLDKRISHICSYKLVFYLHAAYFHLE